tara:strand:+ start:4605 stop:4802 length:198 start_codon:yes stop_codon:yes gene_type:complete
MLSINKLNTRNTINSNDYIEEDPSQMGMNNHMPIDLRRKSHQDIAKAKNVQRTTDAAPKNILILT